MSTELATLDLNQLPSTQVGNDEQYDDLARGGDFLGRLQLFTKGEAIDSGKIPPGHWGIPENKDTIIDLGTAADILPLARRPKAIDMSDKEAVVNNYDSTSEEFKRIVEASEEKDSGCQWGTSFLVLERSTGRFLELFFGSKSSRPEAKKIFPYLPLTQGDIDARKLQGEEPRGPQPVTLGVRHVKTAKFSWHVPDPRKCSTPFAKTPPMKTIVAEITKFVTAKSGGVEKVPEKEDNRRKRAR